MHLARFGAINLAPSDEGSACAVDNLEGSEMSLRFLALSLNFAVC